MNSIVNIARRQASSSGGTVSHNYPADSFTGMTSAHTFEKASSTYSGDWAQVQRQSDGATLEVGWLNDYQANLSSIISWASGSQVNIVRWYDSTGNGNDLYQNTLSRQPIIYDGTSMQTSDNGLIWTSAYRLELDLTGSPTPDNQSRLDLYWNGIIDAGHNNRIYHLFTNGNINDGRMLFGISGGTGSLNFRVGTPTYYFNGSASGWTNNGDAYTDIVTGADGQISALELDTTNAAWSNYYMGVANFGYNWSGNFKGMYMFAADSSGERVSIELELTSISF